MSEPNETSKELRRRFEAMAKQLQRHLGASDRMTAMDNRQLMVKQLLVSAGQLRLRMSADRNHARPHLHIDYGPHHHAVSIAVDDSAVLAGTRGPVPRRLIEFTRAYVDHNRQTLLEIWADLKRGGAAVELIEELPEL